MADDSNVFVRNEAEEADSKVEEDTKVVEGDSEESEEEPLVYDRPNGDTSEDSGKTHPHMLVTLV